MWMEIRINKNEPTPSRRRLYFQCLNVLDGRTPETGEEGGQPEISLDGGSWTTVGIGTLVSIGNGKYYADISQSTTNFDNAIILSRYKSINTIECDGSTGIIDSNISNLDSPISTVLSNNDPRLEFLDADISSRLSISSYVAPDNSTISTISSDILSIPLNPVLSTDPRLNALDTTISSRSTLTSNEVWSNTIRTLTSGGGSGGATPTEIWSYPTRTITGASGLASSIWEYEDRTLTGWRQIVIDIWNAIPSWLVKRLEQYVESDYSLYKGVTNEISIISNVKLMGASNIVFSIKNKSSDTDDKSILRIESLNGLVTMNGGQYPTPTDGQIVTFDENTGSIKIVLSSNASDEIIPSQKRLYDIKVKVGDEVKLVSRGKVDLLPDVTNVV